MGAVYIGQFDMADLIGVLTAHAWPIAWGVIVALAIAAVAVAVRHRPQSGEDTDAGWPLDILFDAMEERTG